MFEQFVRPSVLRLGYIKEEYVAPLSDLMVEHFGLHPEAIARKFRQKGVPLTKDQKRAVGLRANTDMTHEALSALTVKGAMRPIDGICYTVLDAMFSYYRHRDVSSGNNRGYDRFIIDTMFNCAGCSRLKGKIVSGDFINQIPPHDCEREACSMGMALHIEPYKR